MSDESEPTFKKPDDRTQQKADDPNDGMRSYFAYYEAKRIIDRQKARREWDSLSVYERARRKYEPE
jgi:hypothetical protein